MDSSKIRDKSKGISIIESLVCLVIVGIGFIAINQMIAFSVASMDRSMERTKVNFLSESAVEDIMGDPNNASSYNFTQNCNKGSYSQSDLAGKKKDKWSKIFKAESMILGPIPSPGITVIVLFVMSFPTTVRRDYLLPVKIGNT